MRILVTDGMDKSAMAQLREQGHEVVEQFYEPDQLGKALRDFDAVVVRSKTKVRANHIDEAKGAKLKLIIRGGVGVDNIDVKYAEENGIKVMSLNLLVPNEEDPVIWRGPVIANMVKQFWSDVIWGELDFLFVDMPPGTGDVPLTVFQSLPVEGIVIVSSPQDLVRMIVTKAFNMAKAMKIPVLGIVENYSYLVCPDCGKKISVFGESHIDEIAASLETEVLGKMPIDPSLASLADGGKFSGQKDTHLDAAVEKLYKLYRENPKDDEE